jgi:hypothetical protein
VKRERDDASVRGVPTSNPKAWSDAGSLPTEIFLPLVHYASQSLVTRYMQRESNAAGEYEDQDQDQDSGIPIVTEVDAESPTASSKSTSSAFVAQSSLDIHVEASHGRTAVKGQYLKWWYDIPVEGQGPREVEHTITITRLGGAIDLRRLEGRTRTMKERCWDGAVSMFARCCPQ